MKRRQTTYIYGLKDPRDGKIYYVGKSNNPKYRLYQHVQDKSINQLKISWIENLLNDGLEPELVILQEVKIEEWPECEIEWIEKGLSEGWPLTNINQGGIGSDGSAYIHDYEFMQNYISPELWNIFDGLSKREKDKICIRTAQAMIGMYKPFLDKKIEMRQYAMYSIIRQEEFFIGQRAATAAVNEVALA